MTLTTEQRRARRIQKIRQNVEAQIYMLDDPEDVMLLGTIFLATVKNIFLAQYSKRRTRELLLDYINEVTEEDLDNPPKV